MIRSVIRYFLIFLLALLLFLFLFLFSFILDFGFWVGDIHLMVDLDSTLGIFFFIETGCGDASIF